MLKKHSKPNAVFSALPGQASVGTVILFSCVIIFALAIAFNIHKFSPIMVLAIVSGLAVAVITLVNTNFGLVILIFSMLWSPEIPIAATAGRAVVIRIDDFLIITVFFTWLAKMALFRQTGFIRHTPLNKPILAYIGVHIFSSLLGAMAGNVSLKVSIFHILKIIEFFMVYFLFINNLKDAKQLKLFLSCFLLCSFFISIFAYSQFGQVDRVTTPFEGEFPEPNTLGGYLMLTMAMAAALFLNVNFSFGKFLLAGFFLFSLPPLLMTLSRGSYVSMMVAMISLAFFTRKGKMFMVSFLVFSILILPLVVPETVKNRVAGTFQSNKKYEIMGEEIALETSAAVRLTSFEDVKERLPAHPFLGYGVSGAGFVETQYVRYLLELGMFGFLIALWLLISVMVNIWKVYNSMEEDFSKGLALGTFVGYIGILIMGLTACVFVIVRIAEPFWFMVACVMALPEIYEPQEVNPVVA